MSKATRTSSPVVFYDGSCALCAGVVRCILRRDRGGEILFAPLGGRTARAHFASRFLLENEETFIFADESAVFERSDAVLALLRYLGGWYRLASVIRFIPRRWRDSLYDVVARHRHRFMRPRDACAVVDESDRVRFLP